MASGLPKFLDLAPPMIMYSSKTFEKFRKINKKLAQKFKKFSKIFQKENLIKFKQREENLNKFKQI